MREINKIIVHCSDSSSGRGDTAATIHDWHLQRAWDGIGYHYVILENGTVENGRPEYWKGSHCFGANAKSIGICLIGIDEFTAMQFESLRALICDLRDRYPGAAIAGHRDYDNRKTCPSFDVAAWWEKSRQERAQ